jgi:hypothetical protein
MIHALTLFPQSSDFEAVKEFVATQLLPSLNDIPGLRSVKFSKGHVMSPGGPPAYTNVLEYEFNKLEDMMNWVQTPSARENREQLETFGATLLYYEVGEQSLS